MKTNRIWRALSVALALCLTLALVPTWRLCRGRRHGTG